MKRGGPSMLVGANCRVEMNLNEITNAVGFVFVI